MSSKGKMKNEKEFIISWINSNLGINPVKGGIPLRDKREIENMR